jgi:hypothetical protein
MEILVLALDTYTNLAGLTNNKTNKQRKEEQSLNNISSLTQILNSESHVAYQVHIEKFLQLVETLECSNRGVIVSALATRELDRVFKAKSGQTKDICCFSA